MIIERVGLVATPSKQEEIQGALAAWVGPTAVERGCLGCRILQEGSRNPALWYEAEWRSHDDLVQHLRSEHYKHLLFLMDLGSEQPVIQFHIVAETLGMELILDVRNAS